VDAISQNTFHLSDARTAKLRNNRGYGTPPAAAISMHACDVKDEMMAAHVNNVSLCRG
jgi:hypothetical protein